MDQSKFIYSTKKGSFIILISLMMIFNNFGLILATWASKYRSTGFLGPTILGQIHWQKTLLHSQFRYHRWLNVQQRRKLFMVFMLNSVQIRYGVSKNQEILTSGLIGSLTKGWKFRKWIVGCFIAASKCLLDNCFFNGSRKSKNIRKISFWTLGCAKSIFL